MTVLSHMYIQSDKTSVNSAPMAGPGGSMRASAGAWNGPPSQRSAQGEPRPVAPGPSGSTYAAHNHIGGNYGIRSVLSGLRILEECVSPDAMLGFEG